MRWLFNARGQVVIGAISMVLGGLFWIAIEVLYAADLSKDPVTAAIFRVSMFFGLVAAYAIIATGLGYKETEKVERWVNPNKDDPE